MADFNANELKNDNSCRSADDDDVVADDDVGNEVVVTVSKELASLSLGFSFDAGGSVTKLVYRSKEDYVSGKRISDPESPDGVLRMRYFKHGDYDALIRFILDNCDVMESVKRDRGGGEREWCLSGVETQHFQEKVEDVFKLRVHNFGEADAVFKGLRGFYSGGRYPSFRPVSLAPQAVDAALVTTREMLRMMQSSMELDDGSYAEMGDKMAQLNAYIRKLMTTDGTTMASELSCYDIEWPCLTVMCGSAELMTVMAEDGSFDIGDFCPISGKTFVGLGRLVCGAKDYDELIKMAARGDRVKVDTMTGDLKKKDRDKTASDWYSVMPDIFTTFAMGKTADDSYSGTYSKDDLAAAILRLICTILAKLAHAAAVRKKTKCVVLMGSFIGSRTSLEVLQTLLLELSLMMPFDGDEPLKWVFPPYPGFIGALGCWYRNWETEQKEQSTSS